MGKKAFLPWFNQMFNRNAERYEKGGGENSPP